MKTNQVNPSSATPPPAPSQEAVRAAIEDVLNDFFDEYHFGCDETLKRWTDRLTDLFSAQHAALTKELADSKSEIDAYAQTQVRLGELLNGVAVALRGEPKPLTAHGWDRLPEEVRQLRVRCLELEGLIGEAQQFFLKNFEQDEDGRTYMVVKTKDADHLAARLQAALGEGRP